jgi:aminoglycoside 3-N-acetyltransferase
MFSDTKYIHTKDEIFAQLVAMGAPRDSVVLAHSSLRTIGAVEGGAEALLDVMIEYFTAEGGLFCVPTHTWHRLGEDIVLDMSSDENCLGAFSTVALRDKRGIRSENPTHSMVVFGDRERAEQFVRDDEWVRTPTAPNSAYGKICDESGYILLMGVSQNKNTYLHAVAEILDIPNRMERDYSELTVRRASGECIKREFKLFFADFSDDVSHRFEKYDMAFRYHGCIADGFIGNAPTQLCDARRMKETVELIFKNSGGIDPLATEEPIPPRWYC